MKYYLITAQKSDGGYTNPIQDTFVISESPENFFLRNKRKEDILKPYIIILYSKKINMYYYNELLQRNPSRESYFKLQERDYSIDIEEEEYDEEEE